MRRCTSTARIAARWAVGVLIAAALLLAVTEGCRLLYCAVTGIDPWRAAALGELYDRAVGAVPGPRPALFGQVAGLLLWFATGTAMVVRHKPIVLRVASVATRCIPSEPDRAPIRHPGGGAAPSPGPAEPPAAPPSCPEPIPQAIGTEPAQRTTAAAPEGDAAAAAALERLTTLAPAPGPAPSPPTPSPSPTSDPEPLPRPAPSSASLALAGHRYVMLNHPLVVPIAGHDRPIQVAAMAVDGTRLIMAMILGGSAAQRHLARYYQFADDGTGTAYELDKPIRIDSSVLQRSQLPEVATLADAWLLLSRFKEKHGLLEHAIDVRELGPVRIGTVEMAIEFFIMVDGADRLMDPAIAVAIASLDVEPPMFRLVSAQEHPGLTRFWDAVRPAAGVDPVADRELLVLAESYLLAL